MRSLLPYFVIVIVLSSLGCANEVPSVDVEAERTALLEANRAWVAAAAAGALAAFFTGFTGAGVVLLVGVTIHGFGWLYLYNQRDSDASD